MKTNLSKRSEELSYIAKVICRFCSAVTASLMIAVLVPAMAQYAVPVSNGIQMALEFSLSRGFAANANERNFFGEFLDYVRDNTTKVMLIDFALGIATIICMLFYPTLGFILFPITGVLDLFVDQVFREDVNNIFAHDEDKGAFRTYFENQCQSYGTGAALGGSVIAIILTTMFTVSVAQCIALILIHSFAANIVMILRRRSIHKDALKLN